MGPRLRPYVIPGVLVGAIVLVAVSLVLGTLGRPEPPTWPPTRPAPREVGGARVGPVLYTVDASDGSHWRFFDFSRGSVVEDPGPLEWDLAFRRNEIAVNGGPGFEGRGGARRIAGTSLDSLGALPEDGYLLASASRDSANPTFDDWYDYSFTSHLLTPRPHAYAVRTADGRYAAMEILGYYCPGARSGCVTFRYVYRGDDSPEEDPGPQRRRRL